MTSTTSSVLENNKVLLLGGVLGVVTSIFLDFHFIFLIDALPQSTTLPISFNSSESPCYANPYCDINVKALMMDSPNVYIHQPLAKLLNYWLDFANTYKFISANAISLSHVPIALIAGRLVSHDSLCHRRIGVLLFETRNFLDALDGAVAIARRQQTISPHNSRMVVELGNQKTINATRVLNKITSYQEEEDKINQASAYRGYIVDGLCDGVGCFFLFIGCFVYLQKHPIRKSLFSYNPLPLVVVSTAGSASSNASSDSEQKAIRHRVSGRYSGFRFRSRKYIAKQILRSVQRSGLMVMTFGFQSLFGSIAWNRYIANYSRIMEEPNPPTLPPSLSESQEKEYRARLLHSPLTWLVFFMWKYINPHAMVEVLLVAVFFDRMGELLSFLQFLGFLPILLGTCLSEVYMYSIELNA